MRHRMWVMEHNNRNLIEYFKNMFLVYSDMFFGGSMRMECGMEDEVLRNG